ncbi:MAG: DNA cytosine methyltransferase [Paraclostridium sp.]
MLNVLDIFSGIGGFSLGLEAATMQTVAFCEINPFCRKILKKHWPSIPIFTDITTINKEDLKTLPRIDVIVGGFPCQDVSIAGKKKGINAKRSGLWKEFVRLINEIRPKYAIIENVANLRSTGLINVLQDLWKIRYDAEWHCIPASAFGAPHRRDRIWIIAYPSCESGFRLSLRKEEEESFTGINCKNVSDSDCQRLQGCGGFEKTGFICTQEQVSMYYSSRGIKQWGKELLEVPRLKDDRLNPDWVEWLMGYPISWTDGGSRKERLVSLGNSVVPLIPEFLGQSIINHYTNIQ